MPLIGPALEGTTQQRFDDGKDPDGIDWQSYAPLNPLYAEDKQGKGILVADGTLRDTITSIVIGDELLVGSAQPYAPVHQFGAIIHPKDKPHLSFMMGGHLFKMDEVHIPARPYLGLSDEDKLIIIESLEHELVKAGMETL